MRLRKFDVQEGLLHGCEVSWGEKPRGTYTIGSGLELPLKKRITLKPKKDTKEMRISWRQGGGGGSAGAAASSGGEEGSEEAEASSSAAELPPQLACTVSLPKREGKQDQPMPPALMC